MKMKCFCYFCKKLHATCFTAGFWIRPWTYLTFKILSPHNSKNNSDSLQNGKLTEIFRDMSKKENIKESRALSKETKTTTTKKDF